MCQISCKNNVFLGIMEGNGKCAKDSSLRITSQKDTYVYIRTCIYKNLEVRHNLSHTLTLHMDFVHKVYKLKQRLNLINIFYQFLPNYFLLVFQCIMT